MFLDEMALADLEAVKHERFLKFGQPLTMPKIMTTDKIKEASTTNETREQIFGKPSQLGANIRKTSGVKSPDVIAFTRFGTDH